MFGNHDHVRGDLLRSRFEQSQRWDGGFRFEMESERVGFVSSTSQDTVPCRKSRVSHWFESNR